MRVLPRGSLCTPSVTGECGGLLIPVKVGSIPAEYVETRRGLKVSHLLWEQGIMGVRFPSPRLGT